MLESLKAPFLALHFSCYTLITFVTMLSVILLSMLMILFFILSLTRILICGNNLNWLLNFNLIYETLWTWVRNGLLISVLGKRSWFCLTSLITMVLLIWKWMGLFLRKNDLSRCWVFVLWSFFLLMLLCISINLPYAHVWKTVVISGLALLVATWNC